jgi:hypothetical protein
MAGKFLEKDAHGNSKAKADWDSLMAQCLNPEDMEKSDYVYAVSEIKLFEGSTVAFGANSLTPYLGVKSGNSKAYELMLIDRLSKLESVFKNGTQSDESLEMIGLQVLQLKQMMVELCKKLKPKAKPGAPIVEIEKPVEKNNEQEKINLTNIASVFELKR